MDSDAQGYYSEKNRLNDLTGKEWIYWSKSVINNRYPPGQQHQLRSQHGGQKPPELCRDLIKIFTKKGQTVLDPFAGVGGTLLGASLCDRDAYGIEIDPRYGAIYREVCRRERIKEQVLVCADSRTELDRLAQDDHRYDLVLTDVPYWNMDSAPRSKGKFKRVGQPPKERRMTKLKQFGSIRYRSKEHWLEELAAIFAKTRQLLAPGKYLAVFIGDMYFKKQYHFLSADVANLLTSLNLTMKANLIWYDVSKSLHIYGYRYQFIPSIIHQSVLIFRKEND